MRKEQKIKTSLPGGVKSSIRRIVYRVFLSRVHRPILNDLYVYRESVAGLYIRGGMFGIEIGALDRPLWLPRSVRRLYVDRLTRADLIKAYPEKADSALVDPDIIDDCEKLENIEDKSQDFIIANHFIEHCRNPIGAIGNMMRVLRPGGILFMSVPDKRYIFDADRPVTPFDHILNDYKEGPEKSDRLHYEEWVALVEKKPAGAETEKRVASLFQAGESIHFHVWTLEAFMDFIKNANASLNSVFEVEHFSKNGYEVVIVLKRSEG